MRTCTIAFAVLVLAALPDASAVQTSSCVKLSVPTASTRFAGAQDSQKAIALDVPVSRSGSLLQLQLRGSGSSDERKSTYSAARESSKVQRKGSRLAFVKP